MDRAGGDDVDGAAEDGRELASELLDLPAEPTARFQLLEHVDVAVGRGGPACDGAEHPQAGYAVPRAHVGESRLVNGDAGKLGHW